jgi:phenylpyruvate tautomerase PptA (4-oxalocrotonate tautomerase family)
VPFVTVNAAPAGVANQAIATELAALLAQTLGLRPSDIYVALVASQAGTDGAGMPAPFIVVDIRGRRRPAESEHAASAAARKYVAEVWQCAADAVWVQWHRPA